MNSVTFPEALGGNGQTYTDDADPNTGLDGLGYTTRFIPCLQQAVVMGLSAQSNAQACADYMQQCQTLREEVGTDRQAVADDRTHVDQQKGLVDSAAQQVTTDRQAVADNRTHVDQQKGLVDSAAQQVATDRQAVADDRTHVDQQKGLVDSAAQQVATDRQAVADDRLASQQAADASSDAAEASIQARNEAQALYGDLNAVETAKTQAQTAREGAENAQEGAETAAGQSQQAANQAVTEHEAKADPHSQYEKKMALKAAAYRDVVGGGGALMADGFNGFGGTLPTDVDANNLYGKTQFKRLFGNSANAPTTGSNWAVLNLRRAENSDVQLALSAFGPPRAMLRTTDSDWAEQYHSLNSVGSVSQLGGTPTGALIERDSNSFGEWTKWADGTMECWAYVQATYQTASYLQVVWTYPQPFLGSGRVTPEAMAVSSLDGAAIAGSDRISAFDPVNFVTRNSTATSATVRVVKQASSADFQSGQAGTIKLRAIGRWY